MNPILPEELEQRHSLAKRYQDAQKKAVIDDQIRGIRLAINFLIAEERKLIEESEALNPAKRQTGARGGGGA
jgi:hypothetical protein